MIFNELELKIKQLSADLQKIELELRGNNPLYQRILGQVEGLRDAYKILEKIEGDTEDAKLQEDTGTKTE